MAGKPKRKTDIATLEQVGDDKVLDAIASGMSLRDLCAAYSVSMGSLHKWLTAPERADRYARAREGRAAGHAARIELLADQVEAGDVAPDVARVSIDARKWIAARMDARNWAEQKGPLVNISLAGMHGESLRKVSAQVIEVVDETNE
jgi:hypothetical protein